MLPVIRVVLIAGDAEEQGGVMVCQGREPLPVLAAAPARVCIPVCCCSINHHLRERVIIPEEIIPGECA